MRMDVSLVRSLRPPISALPTMRMLWWLRRGSLSLLRFPRLLVRRGTSEASDTSVVLKDFPLVFIRGPFVAEVGERATVETSVDGNVVGLRQGKILATAFHPELTDDTRIHELFLSL